MRFDAVPVVTGAEWLLVQNGPCKIDASHTSTTSNPYSWNSNASIVFIDQPAGVGDFASLDYKTAVELHCLKQL
jgi:carboxypeptidase C (cathepsin A)